MALPESSSQDDQRNKSNDQDDQDFDPSAQALIDEIDDERTLEEEEALNANTGAAVQEELDDLKKESEMPIEELLAYYERMRQQAGEEEEDDDDEDDDEEEYDEEEEQDRQGSNREVSNAHRTQGNSETNNSSNLEHPTPDSNQVSRAQTTEASSSNAHQVNSNDNDTAATSISSSVQPVEETSKANEAASSPTTEPSSRERQRHTMTDFLIADHTGAVDGMFKSLLDYDLDDSDDMDEDYSYTDDEENGEDEKDWRRSIHVGNEYQAEVPEGLCEYGDLPPYENEDKLVWKCNPEIEEEELVDYLKKGSVLSKRNDVSVSPSSVPKISNDSIRLYRERMQDITSSTGSHVPESNLGNTDIQQTNHPETVPQHHQNVYMSQSRKRVRIDYELEQENAIGAIALSTGLNSNNQMPQRPQVDQDNEETTSQDNRPELSTEEYFQDEEQLLYLLLQCNYNMDEALRRRKLDPFKYYLYEPMSLWSDDECLGFEHGLRLYGKDFRSIRENKVLTRTRAEVVTFYYLWKKSERHDVYTNQYKLDRKRSLTHPGTTDYMDKFIEDNESILNTSSPSTPTPIIADSGTCDLGHKQSDTPEFVTSNQSPASSGLPISVDARPHPASTQNVTSFLPVHQNRSRESGDSDSNRDISGGVAFGLSGSVPSNNMSL